MPVCCVPRCTKRRGKDPNKFYSIPLRPSDRRTAFVKAINRVRRDGSKWEPSVHAVICNEHFVNGRKSDDPSQENYIPTVKLPPHPVAIDRNREGKSHRVYKLPVSVGRSTVSRRETVRAGAGSAVSTVRESHFKMKKVTRRTADRPPDKLIPIIQLNPHITCPLCTGYLIQPCTITECNHTYCKSCIIKHIGFSLQCPVCDINIHPTDPLSNIRRDYQKESIIHKLLPHLETDEFKREQAFYKERGIPFPGDDGKKSRKKHRLLSERMVSLVLEFAGSTTQRQNYKPLVKKFIRVSAKVSISQIQTFIRKKTGLPSDCEVAVFIDTGLVHEKASIQQLIDNIPDLEEDGLIVLHYGLLNSSVASIFNSL